jgi:hypothetical protein
VLTESIEELPANASLKLVATKVVCDSIEGTWYYNMVQNMWKLIDMSIYAFIPFTIMLICSGIIIGRVAQQANKFNKTKKSVSNPSASSNNINNNSNRLGPGGSSTVQSPPTNAKTPAATPQLPAKKQCKTSTPNVGSVPAKSANELKFSSRTRNLALMLIPVNILFLLFLAPVVLTIYFYGALSQDQLTLAIVELVSNCNFTLNFFIYFVTSSKFREEFWKFLNEVASCFCKRPNNSASNFNSANHSKAGGAAPQAQRHQRPAVSTLGPIVEKSNGHSAECVALINSKNQSE